ncbi:hypothetical protein ACXZ1K_01090 [Pedobacter sp. PWIIR3]
MRNAILLISLSITLILSQAKGQTAEQLEQAYQEQSTIKLKAFFDDWSKELPPASPAERKNMRKVVQQAYAIFEAFYNPHDLANHGGTQWGDTLYKGYKYLITGTNFKIFQREKVYYTEEEEKAYAIEYIKQKVDKQYHERFINWAKAGDRLILNSYGPNKNVWEDSTKLLIDSVRNFRPQITLTKATPLYLTEKYNKLLSDFLGNELSAFTEGGIMNTAQAKGESAARQKFLLNYIKIYHGHWGSGWEYYSGPVIGALVFDKDMKYAKVFYGIIYEGGEAILKFEDNTWKLISMKRTWRQ